MTRRKKSPLRPQGPATEVDAVPTEVVPVPEVVAAAALEPHPVVTPSPVIMDAPAGAATVAIAPRRKSSAALRFGVAFLVGLIAAMALGVGALLRLRSAIRRAGPAGCQRRRHRPVRDDGGRGERCPVDRLRFDGRWRGRRDRTGRRHHLHVQGARPFRRCGRDDGRGDGRGSQRQPGRARHLERPRGAPWAPARSRWSPSTRPSSPRSSRSWRPRSTATRRKRRSPSTSRRGSRSSRAIPGARPMRPSRSPRSRTPSPRSMPPARSPSTCRSRRSTPRSRRKKRPRPSPWPAASPRASN